MVQPHRIYSVHCTRSGKFGDGLTKSGNTIDVGNAAESFQTQMTLILQQYLTQEVILLVVRFHSFRD